MNVISVDEIISRSIIDIKQRNTFLMKMTTNMKMQMLTVYTT